MLEQKQPSTPNQETWDNIVNIINTAAENTLGFKEHKPKYINNKIIELSSHQKQLNIQINSTKNEELERKLKKQRNRILTEIHNQVKAVFVFVLMILLGIYSVNSFAQSPWGAPVSVYLFISNIYTG